MRVTSVKSVVRLTPAKPNAKAYSRAYMLQYKGGTISFMGDHNDLAPFEPYVFDSPPRFATRHRTCPPVKFLGSWGGDNREALFPSGDLFDNARRDAVTTLPAERQAVSACNGGARNSNGYAAYIGPANRRLRESELQAARIPSSAAMP